MKINFGAFLLSASQQISTATNGYEAKASSAATIIPRSVLRLMKWRLVKNPKIE
ncbi:MULTISPECIES: hypothetical protein [unclassified Erwinia]|uniref:hypothetical protein n=1 Tax=unclassified Erwinia TaxID=2622719 RepID=UPI000B2D1152|nr:MULTISPECIES: hypothetical protein [unclassified Erwinia]